MFETLGHYKILDRIGTGGIGEVYRARDTRLGRTVAIKVVKADIADDPDRRGRFLQDARAAAALSHPNIAALYEIGEDQDQLFLVFEYVPGETLKKAIAGRPLNPRRAIDHARLNASRWIGRPSFKYLISKLVSVRSSAVP